MAVRKFYAGEDVDIFHVIQQPAFVAAQLRRGSLRPSGLGWWWTQSLANWSLAMICAKQGNNREFRNFSVPGHRLRPDFLSSDRVYYQIPC